MSALRLTEPGDRKTVETGDLFMPSFDAAGLIVCVTCDHGTGALLMVAHMNEEALLKTIASGEAHYWSRSREELWHKGATSGATQKVIELRTDCDQDAIQLLVAVADAGSTCHTGKPSCFYRRVGAHAPDGDVTLEPIGE